MKGQTIGLEKMSAKHMSDKELPVRIYNELLKALSEKKHPNKNGQEIWTFTKDIWMANNHMKRYSISFIIREM